jgi:hypothetical protein
LIDFNDYIRYRTKRGVVVTKYKSYCDECGESKGYQEKSKSRPMCHSCTIKKRLITDDMRKKISEGVKRYYNNKYENIEILDVMPSKKRISNPTEQPSWKRIRKEVRHRDKKYPENTIYDFSDEEIKIFLQQSCFYCGDISDIGLDRIDNLKGHCKENCLPCCTLCNLTRGNRYTYDEFKQIGKIIRDIKIKREIYKTQ